LCAAGSGGLPGVGGGTSPFQPLCDAVAQLEPLCAASAGGLPLP
jgi:hypothetical protein